MYEVIALIGKGGMGEVYRATDTRLKRQVAIKVLPPSWASDADRLARFQREAEVLASLNHPKIAQIHGLEESNGVTALVMEFVDGEDLSQRIAHGAIPVAEALAIARQIAEALEGAHEQGIIHRDLKPANIKVRDDGSVKVLDFGLAKALEPQSPTSVNVSASPTLTSPLMTASGMILGTAAYMSPEQARGRRVDRRADIWAFGCVCYEMLTGKRAVSGDDVSEVLASVLAREPDWTLLPSDVPAGFVAYLRRCLSKDPAQRIRDIGDVRLALEGAFDSAQVTVPIIARQQAAAWSRAFPWAMFGVTAALLAATVVVWAPWRSAAGSQPVRVLGVPAPDVTLTPTIGARVVISPDGTMIAFIANGLNAERSGPTPQIFVRKLAEQRASPLAGTENAVSTFFSPDNRWLAFFADGKLKKVALTGGAVAAIANAPNPRGGTWMPDGSIVFAAETSGALTRVPSTGGTSEPATTLEPGDASHRWPQAIGGNAVLFSASGSTTAWSDASLVIQEVPQGSRVVVHKGGHYGRLLPNGSLVYARDGVLFAASFDARRREVTSPPTPVLDGIETIDATGGAQFAFSDNGTLVYGPGQAGQQAAPINLIDQAGQAMTLQSEPSEWSNPHFSPDGSKLAFDVSFGGSVHVWVRDLARDSLARVALDPTLDVKPVWTPDGRSITFSAVRTAAPTLNLYTQRADGVGDVQRLTDSGNPQFAGSWHPSGKYLAFYEQRPDTKEDLMILPMEGDAATGLKPGTPRVFLGTAATELEPMFSPDGRWIAYQSNELGTTQVFVQPFPGPGGKWKVSTDGGSNPTWSKSRPEIFYRALNLGRVMVVPYEVEGDSFKALPVHPWSPMFLGTRPRQRYFDLHPDGNRIVALPPRAGTGLEQRVVFVFNFFDELRRLMSAPPVQ